MARMTIHIKDVAMQVTATEAKNKFSKICAAAKKSPVFISKNGKIDSVAVSFSFFQDLKERQAVLSTNSANGI